MSELVKRNLSPVVARYLQHFPAVLIEGARQVGKSTLARQVAPDAEVLNLDHQHHLDAARADALGVLSAAGGPVIVDEIQRLPELSRTIKALIDEDRRPGRFILTGSASLLRMIGTQDSMAGRVARVNLYGFSAGERMGVADAFVDAIARGVEYPQFATEWTREDYVRQCVEGAYPEVVGLPPDLRGVWLDSYLAGIIQRDLLQLRRQVQPARAQVMLKLLAAEQSGETVKAKLGQRGDVPANTVGAYLDLLADVQFVAPIKPWKPNLARREIGKPKTLVLDSALAIHLAGVSETQLRNRHQPEAFGRFLEGLVAAELLKQRGWSTTPYEVFHYRDTDGEEVDLVLELTDGRIIGVEVKAALGFQARQFAGLARLRDRLGDRFVAGIVLGTGQVSYRYADRLWGLPVASVWELAAAE